MTAKLSANSLRSSHQDSAAIAEVCGVSTVEVLDAYERALDLPNTQQHYQRYLSAIVQLWKPDESLHILETGMEKGASTMQLLNAIMFRQALPPGHLVTVDCSFADTEAMLFQLRMWDTEINDEIDDDAIMGVLWAPWNTTSREYFEAKAFEKTHGGRHIQKNVFLHDSDHSYENMTYELNYAWDNILVDGGLLLSDDWMWDNERAWNEFVERVQQPWYTAGHMAIMVKP